MTVADLRAMLAVFDGDAVVVIEGRAPKGEAWAMRGARAQNLEVDKDNRFTALASWDDEEGEWRAPMRADRYVRRGVVLR